MKFDLPKIKASLLECFNNNEIKDLCFELDIRYDDIEGGESNKDKVRELLTYLDRRSRIPDLIAYCQKERPSTAWNLIKTQQVQAQEFVEGIGLTSPINYLDPKFEMYKSVWEYLNELKSAGDVLWQRASKENIANFASALRQAYAFVRINEKLFEEQDYYELIKIFTQFGKFEAGKVSLLEIRNENDEFLIYADAAQYQIKRNQGTKIEYEQLLDVISYNFKRKLLE